MFGKSDVYINGIEGFWSFAKENMAKHHGVSLGKFLLYIKRDGMGITTTGIVICLIYC